MDRKPVFYGLIGLLAGSAITAGLMVYSAKTQLQTATLVGSTGTTTATPSGSPPKQAPATRPRFP